MKQVAYIKGVEDIRVNFDTEDSDFFMCTCTKENSLITEKKMEKALEISLVEGRQVAKRITNYFTGEL